MSAAAGRVVRAERIRQGRSLADVAESAGFKHRASVSDYEQGRIESLEPWARLAGAVGISCSTLLGHAEKMARRPSADKTARRVRNKRAVTGRR